MMSAFRAEEFLEKLKRGEFEGRIEEAFGNLSALQVEQVTALSLRRSQEITARRQSSISISMSATMSATANAGI